MPQFYENEGVGKDVTRWLWFAGDILAGRRRHDLREVVAVGLRVNNEAFRPAMNGGDEVGSPCLLRTKGILPRAYFSPLEMAAVWTPPDLVPEAAPIFRGVVDDRAPWSPVLQGLKAFPGEALASILSTARNDQGLSRGIVEPAALRGVSPEDVAKAGFQTFFFPDYPTLPLTLRGIEESIHKAIARTSDEDLRSIGEEMLLGCDQFRMWATDRVQFEENLVRTGTTEGGWTYRYSDVVESLVTQLEYVRTDRSLSEVARLQTETAKQIGSALNYRGQSSDEIPAPIIDVLQRLQENQEQMTKMMLQIGAAPAMAPAGVDESVKAPAKKAVK
jgi:hypothetical protein